MKSKCTVFFDSELPPSVIESLKGFVAKQYFEIQFSFVSQWNASRLIEVSLFRPSVESRSTSEDDRRSLLIESDSIEHSLLTELRRIDPQYGS